MKITYSSELYSDLHKDAWGFRPAGDHHFYRESDPYKKQQLWDETVARAAEAREYERVEAQRCVKDFNERVAELCGEMQISRATAIRWLYTADEYHTWDRQDIEHFAYEWGILFTDEGREVVEILLKERDNG